MYGVALPERFSKSLIGKIPKVAWWLIFYLLAVGSRWFTNQMSINLLPYQVLGSGTGAAEAGNLIWAHFVYGLVAVLIFELIAMLYYQLAFAFSRGGISVSRPEFVGVLRAYYCVFMAALGVFQVGYYYLGVGFYLYGDALFGIAGRFLVVLCLFFYLKRNAVEEIFLPKAMLAVFVPYLVIEFINLFFSIL